MTDYDRLLIPPDPPAPKQYRYLTKITLWFSGEFYSQREADDWFSHHLKDNDDMKIETVEVGGCDD